MNSISRFHWTVRTLWANIQAQHTNEPAMQNRRTSESISWTLSRGQAQTFRPVTAGVLRTHSGRAWVTWSLPMHLPRPRWCADLEPGDIFLGSEGQLRLAAGQTVVIESWPGDRDSATQLEWQAEEVSASALRWQEAVVQPARNLASALVLASRSLWQLLRGLAGYTDYLVAGRGKVQTCLESNAP
jgi:hypothetical protein